MFWGAGHHRYENTLFVTVQKCIEIVYEHEDADPTKCVEFAHLPITLA